MIDNSIKSKVKVTDSELQRAFDNDVQYLLSLDENRLLAGFYENKGIKTPFIRYGGWESHLIAGHTLGHYLAAVAQGVHSNFANAAQSDALLERLRFLLEGLKTCQHENGFLWGGVVLSENYEEQFDNVEKGRADIVKEAWVPWYTAHKLFGGLIVCIHEVPEVSALAKKIASSFGDWVYNRTQKWDEKTKTTVLSIEYGGMNDCLYDLYKITQKKEHLFAAMAFEEEELYSKILADEENVLNNRHANTTIPKIMGALNRYRTFPTEENLRYLQVAEKFWEIVTNRHSYVTGGNSEWEHFGKDYFLDVDRTNCNCETCNAYNMLKLSRELYRLCGDKKYLDFYENTLINSIFASQNPETGMTTYFQPMASGYFKVFGTPTQSFWCCTGTGMENFTKTDDSIWYTEGNRLYLALYISSEIQFGGATVTMRQSLLNDQRAVLTVKGEADFELLMRKPEWCDGVKILVNGEALSADEENGWIILNRSWKNGDTVTLVFDLSVRAHSLADNPDVYAFSYACYTLCALLGNRDMQQATTGVSVSIAQKPIVESETIVVPLGKEEFLRNLNGYFIKEGVRFVLSGTKTLLTFAPYYRVYNERYGIYWRVSDHEEVKASEMQKIDTVQPGYGQYENDELHSLTEENSVGFTADGTYRYALKQGYFAYTMRVKKGTTNYLRVQFRLADFAKGIEITCGQKQICSEVLLFNGTEEFPTRLYPLSPELLDGIAFAKEYDGRQVDVITVRFAGVNGGESARVCNFVDILTE